MAVSLRADPFPLLRGALGHHALVISLDHELDGATSTQLFPGLNVGFVFCSGRAGGAAHRLLQRFVSDHDVDVALVVKSDRMFSAAQAAPLRTLPIARRPLSE